tara:strand:+ start:1112 stop:2140 length:1029 start_codon:yes stop_codon:yes gene_type:complete
MEYAADAISGGPSWYSLGTPAVADADAYITATGIDCDAVAGTRVTTFAGTLSSTADATFGRNVTLTPSGDPGAAGSILIGGRDYLGQPMEELLTFEDGSTAILRGLKAFMYIDYTEINVASTNAITASLGTGDLLGLPYKLGSPVGARENSLWFAPNAQVQEIFGDTDPLTISAANTVTFVAPFSGWIVGFDAIITTASTVANTTMDCIVDIDGADTGVAALDLDVGWGSSDENIGAKYSIRVVHGTASTAVNAGDRITLTSDGGATAGAATFIMFMTPRYGSFTPPVLTDPQTTTTGDPRGTYTPGTTLDGTLEIEVCYIPDSFRNASGNGGLHGIVHVLG